MTIHDRGLAIAEWPSSGVQADLRDADGWSARDEIRCIALVGVNEDQTRAFEHWAEATHQATIHFRTGTQALLEGCVCCAAIVIEGALSDMSPMSLCRALKRECPNVPILYLVGQGDEDQGQEVVDSGVALSLAQPLDVWEPIIQLCTLLRRSSPPRSKFLQRGPISVDLSRYVATADGSTLSLTRAQFDVLAHLLSSAGRVVTSDELALEALGVRLRPGETGRVRVHIAHLRAALGPAARYLRTVRGRGYLWAA